MAGKKNIKNKVQDLLFKAYDHPSDKKALELADEVLTLDPENPEALMIKADRIDNDNEKMPLIIRAINEINKGTRQDEDYDLLSYALKQRLAFIYFSLKEYDKVFEITRELMKIDPDEIAIVDLYGMARNLHYRTLIELRRWSEILSDSMRDEIHDAAWAYARLIAAFVLSSRDNYENNRTCSRMFCEAMKIAPEVPFYLLGYYDEPDENEDSETLESFNFALMFCDVMDISDEFLAWFSKGAMLFGIFTNRFGREYDHIIDAIDALGGYDEYETLSKIMLESDDEAVLEMLASKGFPLR